MAIEQNTIISKVSVAEYYFATLVNKTIEKEEIGIIEDTNTKLKIERIYYLITSIKLRISRDIFDKITEELYRKLSQEIPFNIENVSLDPNYVSLISYIIVVGGSIIDDSGLVHKSRDEYIDGVKTFIQSPIIPDATSDNEAVTLRQLNNQIGGSLPTPSNETFIII